VVQLQKRQHFFDGGLARLDELLHLLDSNDAEVDARLERHGRMPEGGGEGR